MDKILTLRELDETCEKLRSDGKVIVHVHGCFDVLHLGHVRHFSESKSHGDILVVTVTEDKFVNKGKGRPIFTAQDRAEMISNIECVDYVAVVDAPNGSEVIRMIKPDFYVKGIDYAHLINETNEEIEAVKDILAFCIYTRSEKYSTTEIIRRMNNAG